MANKQYKGDPVLNKKRADLFLIEISLCISIHLLSLLKIYFRKVSGVFGKPLNRFWLLSMEFRFHCR